MELYQQGGVINILDDDEEEIQMNIREALRDPNVSRRVDRRIGKGSVGDVRVSVGKKSITAYFDKQLCSNKVCSPRSVVLWILILEMHLA